MQAPSPRVVQSKERGENMASCGRAALVQASRRLSRALPYSTSRPDECSATAAQLTTARTCPASRGLLFSAARRGFRDLTADNGSSIFSAEDTAGAGEAGLEEEMEETRWPVDAQQQDSTARAAPSGGIGQRRAALSSAGDPQWRSKKAGGGGGRLMGGLDRETSHAKRMKLALFRNDFREARRVLSEAVEKGVAEGRMYYLALSVFSSCKQWRGVLAIFDELRAAGFRPGLHAYNMAIMACSNSNNADGAVELLREMTAAGVVPEVSTYTGVMLAYGNQGRWEEAMGMFGEMIDRGISPDKRAYRAAIDACAVGGRWEEVVRLLRDMSTVGVSPGASSYRAAIMACRKAGQW